MLCVILMRDVCPPRRHRRDGVLVEPRNHGGYLYAVRPRETSSVDIQLTNAPRRAYEVGAKPPSQGTWRVTNTRNRVISGPSERDGDGPI